MTPKGSKATTAPYLTIEPSFNLLDLAKAAGATFCARATTFHVPLMVDVIAKGIAHKGFSIIECVSACPINFGRQNKAGAPAKMMEWQRDHGVMVAAWDRMDTEKKAGNSLSVYCMNPTTYRNIPKLMMKSSNARKEGNNHEI